MTDRVWDFVEGFLESAPRLIGTVIWLGVGAAVAEVAVYLLTR